MKPKTVTLFDVLAGRSVKIGREIAAIEGVRPGPNLVFIGGMHGNEPTGVLALHRVLQRVEQLRPLMSGNVFGLVGNLTALARGERFVSDDLNEPWPTHRVHRPETGDYAAEDIIDEVEEQIGLWRHIDQLIREVGEPFVFVDLRTRGVHTIPFITMSDTLMNRRLARHIPVPVVMGFEAYPDEPLLSYVNELGHPSLVFEAGQHNDPESIRNHEAMIWLCLAHAGVIKKLEIPEFDKYHHRLRTRADGNQALYEIRTRRAFNAEDGFAIQPNLTNFQRVDTGMVLATRHGESIEATERGFLLLPRHRSSRYDGFFLIRRVAKFRLGLSFALRRWNLHRALRFLPGVNRVGADDHLLAIDTSVAGRHFEGILHLMGYRRKKCRDGQILFARAKYDHRGPHS